MAFLTPEELQTHLYKENIETIAREDDAIVAAAIDAAIEEASGYLGLMTVRRSSAPRVTNVTHCC